MKRGYVLQKRRWLSKVWEIVPGGEYDTLEKARADYYALPAGIRWRYRIAETQFLITTRFEAVKL